MKNLEKHRHIKFVTTDKSIKMTQIYITWIQIALLFILQNIADDVKKRFDTSNYEVDRPLSTGKNKKLVGLMKDELGGKIMTEFVALIPKMYSYLMDVGNSDKKQKGTKKFVTKPRLKFYDYKDCLLYNEIRQKSQERFKSEAHNVYTENTNKIALSINLAKIAIF